MFNNKQNLIKLDIVDKELEQTKTIESSIKNLQIECERIKNKLSKYINISEDEEVQKKKMKFEITPLTGQKLYKQVEIALNKAENNILTLNKILKKETITKKEHEDLLTMIEFENIQMIKDYSNINEESFIKKL
jgi:hypothetical protein